MVVVVPDALFRLKALFESGGDAGEVKVADLLTIMRYLGTPVSIEENWLVIKGQDRQRDNRKALARLLVALHSATGPSLDDLAEYALASPAPFPFGPIAEGLVEASKPGSSWLLGELDWETLRLYGYLPQLAKRALLQDGVLDIVTMPPGARRAVHRMIYEQRSPLIVSGPEPLPGRLHIKSEPTEILPNGLRAGMSVRSLGAPPAKVTVWFREGSGHTFSTLASPQQAAQLVIRSERGITDTGRSLAGFSVPSYEALTLGFELSPEVKMQWELRVPKATAIRIGSIDQLPSPLREAIEKEAAAIRGGKS